MSLATSSLPIISSHLFVNKDRALVIISAELLDASAAASGAEDVVIFLSASTTTGFTASKVTFDSVSDAETVVRAGSAATGADTAARSARAKFPVVGAAGAAAGAAARSARAKFPVVGAT